MYNAHTIEIFAAFEPARLRGFLVSAVHAQVYHVSRESFLYLSEFYIGEIAPEDRPLVPVLEVCECCQRL